LNILLIPDVHGTNTWSKFVNISIFDKIIFLGDYFDSFTISQKVAQENFLDILYFKNNNPDKVILLAGNHDNQYIYYNNPAVFNKVKCSGFSASAAWKNNRLFADNIRFFQAAWEHKNVLCTHAGITERHFRNDIEPLWDKSILLSEFLTILWQKADSRILKIGEVRGGNSPYGSIFWNDFSELKADPMIGKHQIVGHTPINKPQMFIIGAQTKVTFVDCIEHGQQVFLAINV